MFKEMVYLLFTSDPHWLEIIAFCFGFSCVVFAPIALLEYLFENKKSRRIIFKIARAVCLVIIAIHGIYQRQKVLHYKRKLRKTKRKMLNAEYECQMSRQQLAG